MHALWYLVPLARRGNSGLLIRQGFKSPAAADNYYIVTELHLVSGDE